MSEVGSEVLRFRVEPTEKDWHAANWLILRYRWRLSRSLPAALALCLLAGSFSLARRVFYRGWDSEAALSAFQRGAALGALVFAGMVVVMVIFLPRGIRRRYEEARKLSTGADVEIDAEGVHFDFGYSTVALAWSQLRCWYENAQMLVMEIATRQNLLVPKSNLDPQVIDSLRAHLVAAQVKRGLT
ncbi:MAG: YcxB family protein [Erythrobacter sp.]|uniref:YcxB family protein n=1 Tax=Erythrobacter sp. TaxID=1042 RepID=UPI0025E2CA6D|nr:YcxB family protein [Erythrobacter sp.]MCL9999879.1 YcxB family protein [Erythrobacter sp.]